jgi:hypothetical protein
MAVNQPTNSTVTDENDQFRGDALVISWKTYKRPRILWMQEVVWDWNQSRREQVTSGMLATLFTGHQKPDGIFDRRAGETTR